MTSTPSAGAAPVAGHVEVSERAVTAIARAVAASGLGVPARRVTVRVGDRDGALALDVAGPIVIGEGLVERTGRIASSTTARVAEITGRRVAGCDIELTGVQYAPVRRVR